MAARLEDDVLQVRWPGLEGDDDERRVRIGHAAHLPESVGDFVEQQIFAAYEQHASTGQSRTRLIEHAHHRRPGPGFARSLALVALRGGWLFELRCGRLRWGNGTRGASIAVPAGSTPRSSKDPHSWTRRMRRPATTAASKSQSVGAERFIDEPAGEQSRRAQQDLRRVPSA